MQRTLLITWTQSEQITIDIPDGMLTSEEISEKVKKRIEDTDLACGLTCDDCDWEWLDGEPKAKGEDSTPPDDAWLEVGGMTIATNGYAVVTKDCPLDGFVNTKTWRTELRGTAIAYLESVLNKDLQSMPLHRGWFPRSFYCFSGLKVVGSIPVPGISTDSAAYVLGDSGELLALLMPINRVPDEDQIEAGEYFQFNPTEVGGHAMSMSGG